MGSRSEEHAHTLREETPRESVKRRITAKFSRARVGKPVDEKKDRIWRSLRLLNFFRFDFGCLKSIHLDS